MNFSAGADLNTMIGLADVKDWKGIDKYLSDFQSTCMKMKYCLIWMMVNHVKS